MTWVGSVKAGGAVGILPERIEERGVGTFLWKVEGKLEDGRLGGRLGRG